MKIIYNNIIPFKGFSAMMFYGVIFARKSSFPLSDRTIYHETIHKYQAKQDFKLWTIYYIVYLAIWLIKGYKNHPFELEAYNNENNKKYLDNRPKYNWRKYW